MLLLLSALSYTVGLLLIILVVMQRREPHATLAWVLVITFLPLVGVLLYLWIGHHRIEKRVRRRQRSSELLAEQLQQMEQTLREFKILPEGTFATPVQRELVRVTDGLSTFAVTRGNAFELLTDPAAVFARLEEAIQTAQDSIHLEYYIYQRDRTGKRIRDLLIEAAQRGVEVRLLVDGVGSWTLGDLFALPLREAGGKFARYLPVTILGRPWYVNLRNHRKIAVIDGTRAYIGSLNIGDEYRERHGRTSDFYDYQIACEGPIVQQLQEVFADDWFFATQENLLQERYFPLPERAGTAIGQVVVSGPDETRHKLHEMLCAALHAAERSVRIVSPYFIPDQALLVALRTAALRGVMVELMLARHLPKHELIALHAARSYYEDLLCDGIHIYEYLPGFLHAKSITIDGAWASVGTTNMDIRSFQLNFEVNVNFYSPGTVAQLERSFEENLHHCEEFQLERFRERSTGQKFLENTLRVFSPIL
jgi:cardiolipin synthase